MLDNPIIQAFIQAWPLMWASPGITLSLLAVGGIVGFGFKHLLSKGVIDGLREQVRSKDDRIEGYKERHTDILLKYNEVNARLGMTMTEVARLSNEVAKGSPPSVLTLTSASITKNIASLSAASGSLGSSLSALDYLRATPVYIVGDASSPPPYYANPGRTTNPLVAPPSGPTPPEPPGKS